MEDRRTYRVTVSKDYLVFASAHFITFPGHRCEPLHGHNYRVGVALEGALDPDSWYVVDFSVLKAILRRACDAIDHKMLLPSGNPRLAIERVGERIHVALDGEPKYVFPVEDCAILDIPNTTVEKLSEYLAAQVIAELRSAGAGRLTMIELEVEENFGQSATYRQVLTANP
jgi:6-pyruvoyltetrahydropterin/6-carboxytetrahydropterin synthase